MRTKLIVISLLVTLIPLTVTSYVSYLTTRQALVDAANTSLAAAAAQTAADADGFIQANLDAARTEAQLPNFGEFLVAYSQHRAAGIEFADATARMTTILRALGRRDQLYILSYGLLDENGVVAIDTDTDDPAADQSHQDYFREPIATGLPYASPVEFPVSDNQPSIYFSAPVRNEQGKIVGVLRIRYSASVLQQLIANVDGLAGKESFAVLLDENHMRLADGSSPDLVLKTIAPIDPARVAELQAADRLLRRPADQLSTNLTAFEKGISNSVAQPFFRAELHNSGTDPEAVAVAHMTTEPWLVAFGQTESVFLAPVEQQTHNAFLVGAVLTLLAALTVAGSTRRLAGPIVRLTAVAEKVRAGDLGAQARVEANDEIGALATTFNTMTRQLRQTLDGLAARTTELRLANVRLESELAERQRTTDALRESEDRFRSFVEHTSEWIFMTDEQGTVVEWNRGAAEITGLTSDAVVGKPLWDVQYQLVSPAHKSPATYERIRATLVEALRTGTSPVMNRVVETQFRRGDGVLRVTEQSVFPIRTAKGFRLSGISRDITERKQAEEEIKRRLAELEAVNQLSTTMRTAQTLDEMLPVVLDVSLDVVHATVGSIWLYDPVKGEVRPAVTRGWAEEAGQRPLPAEKPGEGIAGYAFASQEILVERDFHLSARLSEATRQQIPPGLGGVVIPLRAADNVIGTFNVSVSLPQELTPSQIHLLTILSEVAGNSIQRAKLHEQTERRLQHLAALSDIDRAIISSFDLQLSLATLLTQVIAQLGVDAADVLLFNSNPQILEYAAGRGFRARVPGRTRLSLGQSYAGRAALERRTIHIPDLQKPPEDFGRVSFFAGEGFVSYYSVPLVAKGQVKGVLEIFHRTALEPDEEWIDFLHALARQCAIAIDNATLFNNLQRSKTELTQAYDATIEGWSRALDLRDKETEGHTQRVTDMTVKLARSFGLSEEELAQVRWGALLHDIGKMGVPDAILLKPGRLTAEEWAVMKKHPTFAYEMLSPVRYLRAALDIPYCHHEKWDGTGYPRGLKGEQIPLAARIFAVVDVWDALRSDRPYRAAWTEANVLEHIRSLAGTHFDPHVLEICLQSGVLVNHSPE